MSSPTLGERLAAGTAAVDALAARRPYRWTLVMLRASWLACAGAVLAMLGALVLRSPGLVHAFETLLALTCAAFVVAAVTAGGLALAARTSVGVVVTMLLSDLLDPP